MKQFKTTLFSGYQKKDVDEYLNALAEEMEELRAEAKKAGECEGLRAQIDTLENENAPSEGKIRGGGRQKGAPGGGMPPLDG